MMDGRWWLAADALDRVLDTLAREQVLVGPVRVGEEVVFRRVGGAAPLCRDPDYVNALVPPKEHLLPARERLARYRLTGGRPELEAGGDREPPELVLFGVRSCDVAGLVQLDRFFSGETLGRPETADLPYRRRRARTTILSVVCQHPAETCMCVCCGGGPALASGFDWQLTRLKNGWLVEVGSPRGAALAERFADVLRPADEAAVRERADRVRAVVEDFHRTSPHRVQTMAAGRLVSQGRLPEAFWRDLGEHCFECGGCAYVCPTCSCFNVAELPATGEGVPASAGAVEPQVPGGPVGAPPDGTYTRERQRDCCTLAGFIRQAGGGYPRALCGERCRTRFFHKLSWQFVERVGALGCTGCGRCTIVCLGGIGIADVSERMTDALAAGRAAPAPKGA